MNFLHALAFSAWPVDISLSATLLIDGMVPAGEVRYQDIRKIYPYDNKLVVLRLTGAEMVRYLEASYDAWISTVPGPAEGSHVLRITQTKDYATGGMKWKLAKSPANFDSAAGIRYTVDVTKPYGSRDGLRNGRRQPVRDGQGLFRRHNFLSFNWLRWPYEGCRPYGRTVGRG